MKKRIIITTAVAITVATVIATSAVVIVSLPKRSGMTRLPGLAKKVTVNFDQYANPTIHAASREDSYRALGFITAQERLFQMDLMRRKNAGRLAEIFGIDLLEIDIEQRRLDFELIAKRVIKELSDEHNRLLQAYADGINHYMATAMALPPEFLILNYTPDPWRKEDSILVALGIFQQLDFSKEQERMMTVMDATLPSDVNDFLLPDTDQYSQPLVGGPGSYRPIRAIPVDALRQLQQESNDRSIGQLVDLNAAVIGSNNWAVSASRSVSGHAMVANDMHLPLSAPDIWYRASLHYSGIEMSGVTLPGLPGIIVGSNGHVAWGFTSALADVLDLVVLKVDPKRPNYYRTADGWRPFEQKRATIRIKGEKDKQVTFQTTIWGPVMPRLLSQQPVALHWSALQPGAINVELINMDRAATVEASIKVMNRAGVPVMNVVMADRKGNIGWTMTGKIPRRSHFDGAVSRSWADGYYGWRGFIEPQAVPQLINPRSGFIATANNRTVGGTDYPAIGHNYASGYRAFRINERLGEMERITEQALFELQLDTTTDFYRFYQQLALSVLTEQKLKEQPELTAIHQYLVAWNGHADRHSKGIGLLVQFRGVLAETIFPPFLKRCEAADSHFRYRWFKMDTPLQQILTAKPAKILPHTDQYENWDELILASLIESNRTIKNHFGTEQLTQLRWGAFNPIEIKHPFSQAIPELGWLLNMPKNGGAGCAHCVRVIDHNHGASERMVVAPGDQERAILQITTGESGHPLSKNYADQYDAWVQGRPLPLTSKVIKSRLSLLP